MSYPNDPNQPPNYGAGGYGYDPAAGAASNTAAPYGADYGSYGIDPAAPAGNAPGAPGAHDPA